MTWIRQNTPEDAVFAVNTHFWLPGAPHGTDAGYWIPYFTGRRMTAGVMLLSLGEQAYANRVIEASRAVERLETDNASLETLHEMGVDYVYVGKKGDFSGLGLDPARLAAARNASIEYEDGGVFILQIEPPSRTG
jgi:hypothetical protein